MIKTLILMLAILPSCNEEEERFERVEKLRAIGVQTNPVMAVTSEAPSVTQLTAYLVTPESAEIQLDNYVDPGSDDFIPLDSLTVANSQEVGSLFLHTITGNLAIPPSLEVPEDLGFLRLSYGIKARAGSEVENIVGRVIIVDPNDERSKWKAPTLTIEKPAADSEQGGEIELEAKIDSEYDEQWRVSWFVSSGELVNRRALSTKWKEVSVGTQTAIVTLRGLNSNAFAIQNVSIEVK